MDRAVIEQYAQGADDLTRAIEGLSGADMNARPVPDTWSIQEIVMHMMDSDLIASDRMKRIIAEDNPLILGYDETRFSQRLHYDKADANLACRVFAMNRQMTAALLRLLPDETFQRTGVHNQAGKLTLAQMVKGYHDHLQHHLKFLHQKRRLLGKPAN
ncbi:MAG: DinB family protein [Phycisphaerales bacterium]